MIDIGPLYLVMLALIAGYVLIARVPAILHTPTLSGSNFIHGIVLIGAILALGSATELIEIIIGFVAVTAAAANVVGGFVVTDRMLALFSSKNVDTMERVSLKASTEESETTPSGESGPVLPESPSVKESSRSG